MKTALFFLFIIFSITSVGIVFPARAVVINPNLPGPSTSNCTDPNSTNCNPAAFVDNFYQFALMIGGVLAFGAIVYGGVKYVASAGNPSAQHEGKEWIESALLGLLLLAGAYLILNIINPKLVQLQFPTLPATTAVAPGSGG